MAWRRTLRLLAKTHRAIAYRGLGGVLRLLRDRFVPQPYLLYCPNLESDSSRRGAETVAVTRGDLQVLRAWRARQHAVPPPLLRDVTDGWTTFHWAWIDGALAGIVWTVEASPLVILGPTERVVAGLYTVPQLRRLGIGRALVAAACQDLAAVGIPRVYATVHCANVASCALFESLGFWSLGIRMIVGLFPAKADPCAWPTVPDPEPSRAHR